MIKIERVVEPSIEQMRFVIEGMRNPMNSWMNSDSYICDGFASDITCDNCRYSGEGIKCPDVAFILGKADKELMIKLNNAGKDHRKFMRQMPIMMRITAPIYWWKEFDTYKVGTVRNSCSTMHKITAKEFDISDFSIEYLIDWEADFTCKLLINEGSTPDGYPCGISPVGGFHTIVALLNKSRIYFLEMERKLKEDVLTDNEREEINELKKLYWWQLIQLLPSSYNQTANVTLNYEVLANIYNARKNHKLDEWRVFCKLAESFDYAFLYSEED